MTSLLDYAEDVPNGKRIVFVPLSRVALWPNNAKDHDLGGLGDAFNRWGFRGALEFDVTTGRLVAGHGRIERLEQQRDAGDEPPQGVHWNSAHDDYLVPIIFEAGFVNEAEAGAYVLASNGLTIAGGWHNDLLLASLESATRDTERGLTGTGFDDDDVKKLIAELNRATSAAADEGGELGEPPVPEPPAEPREEPLIDTQPGDSFELGPHRLVCAEEHDAYTNANMQTLTDAFCEEEPAFKLFIVARPGSGLSTEALAKAVATPERDDKPTFLMVSDPAVCDRIRDAYLGYATGAAVLAETRAAAS